MAEKGDRTVQKFSLVHTINYNKGSIVSKTLHRSLNSTITLFAFDEGQQLSEHTSPFDAYVQVLDGKAELGIDGETVETKAGELTIMPANVPHSVKAKQRFKMLLIMVK